MKTKRVKEVKVRVKGVYSEKSAHNLAYLALQRFGDELDDCGAWVDHEKDVATYHCDHGFEKILVKEIEHLNSKGARMTYKFV